MTRAGGSRLDPMFHCGNCGCAILSRRRMRNHFYRRPEKHRLPGDPLSLVLRRRPMDDGTGVFRDKPELNTERIVINHQEDHSISHIGIGNAA